MRYYEETNPPDIEESVVLATIQSIFSKIENPQVRFLYHGTYNVYIVENQYIFRFPSTYHPPKKRREYVRSEVKLLQILGNHLDTPIPEPKFVDLDTDYPYMGYRMIPGAPLTLHYLDAPPAQHQILGNQLGHFIGAFHSIPETILDDEADSFTPEVYRREQSEIFNRVQDLAYPHMSTQQRDWTGTLFNSFLDNDENFEFEPVITHGDLYSVNILVDPETLNLTGIIDFESVRLYDPAIDFIFLREGTVLLSSIIEAYPHKIDPNLGDRAAYFIGKQPFFYSLKGLDFCLERMEKFGYDRITDHMKNWDYFMKVCKESFKE